MWARVVRSCDKGEGIQVEELPGWKTGNGTVHDTFEASGELGCARYMCNTFEEWGHA